MKNPRIKLAEKGVETGIHFSPPLHFQPVYQHLKCHKEGSLPITEAVCSELVTLPIYPELTQKQIEYVAVALEESVIEANNNKGID